MGYSIDLFTHPDSLDKEFICSICHDVMRDPVMSKACEHIYCSSCIAQWRSNHKPITCPIDRKPMRGLRPPIRAYMNMYNTLSLKCSFDGCVAAGLNLGNIEAHAGSCAHNPEGIAPCGSGCGAMIKMKEIPNHACVGWLKGQLSLKETEMQKMKERHAATDANYSKVVRELALRGRTIMELKAELTKKNGQIQALQKGGQVKAPAPVPGISSTNASTTTTTNANAIAAAAAPKRMKMTDKEETSSGSDDDDDDSEMSKFDYLMLGMLLGS